MNMKKEGNIFLEKVNQIGIVNSIVIFVFIIALIYFLIYSIGYFGKKIFNIGEDQVAIYYDYQNVDKYSIENEDKNYNYILLKRKHIFYNIEDVINAMLQKIQFNEYNEILAVLSDDMKQNYNLKNSEYITNLQNFYTDFLSVNNGDYSLILNSVYNIENTDMYVCMLKNKNGDTREIVLKIDFNENTYEIINIEF
ncbi:MAG: hypothetical protein IJX34_02550 [Clostridia bacterium]|nr:hypothetical protein [Clostridia bacterium]